MAAPAAAARAAAALAAVVQVTGGARATLLRRLPALLLAAALVSAVLVVRAHLTDLRSGLRTLGVLRVLLSALAGVGSVTLNLGMWRAYVGALGSPLPVAAAARVFFVGQIGKYLPGSVWPVVTQVSLGRRYRARPAAVAAGGLLALLVSVAVGSLIGCALLPVAGAATRHRFGLLALAAPLLAVTLWRGVLVRLLRTAARLGGRTRGRELGALVAAGLSARAHRRALACSVGSWLLLGTHVWLLAAALPARTGSGSAGSHLTTVPAALAAATLAVSAGILLVPVPAGAGVREVAFVLALGGVLRPTDGLLVALVSRVLFVVIDVALAAAAFTFGPRGTAAEPAGGSGPAAPAAAPGTGPDRAGPGGARPGGARPGGASPGGASPAGDGGAAADRG